MGHKTTKRWKNKQKKPPNNFKSLFQKAVLQAIIHFVKMNYLQKQIKAKVLYCSDFNPRSFSRLIKGAFSSHRNYIFCAQDTVCSLLLRRTPLPNIRPFKLSWTLLSGSFCVFFSFLSHTPVSCGRWARSACLSCDWASRRTWACRRSPCRPAGGRSRSRTTKSL